MEQKLNIFIHISSYWSSSNYSFTIEEIIGWTIESAKGPNKPPRIPSSCFLISCFTVSVTQSINGPESSD